MDVKSVTTDGLFRLFTACPNDTKTFVLDVRPYKEFQKSHIMQSYCIRLAANGQALLVGVSFMPSEIKPTCLSAHLNTVSDSEDAFSSGLFKDTRRGDSSLQGPCCHIPRCTPFVCMLTGHGLRRYAAFQKAFPFLCSASVKNNATKR